MNFLKFGGGVWCRSVLKTKDSSDLSAELSRPRCRNVLAHFWRLR